MNRPSSVNIQAAGQAPSKVVADLSKVLTTPWSSLEGLVFAARRLADGLYAGRHASPQVGTGQDFYDYRAYAPGDSLAALDWKLLARTDRYYVRRHHRQTDLPVMVMVDASASMRFASLNAQGRPASSDALPTKYHQACLLASAIACLAVRQHDRVGLGLLAGKLVEHLPPAGTMAHVHALCHRLASRSPMSGKGDLTASLHQAHRLARRRGLVIVISDLLDEPASLFDGLAPWRHDGWEAMVLQTLAPQEMDLSLPGRGFQLVDAETRQAVVTRPEAIQTRYVELMREHLSRLEQGCLSRGVDYHRVMTPQHVPMALRRYLARRAGSAR